MTILVDRQTRVIVQGITGREGRIYTQQMIEYGTAVLAGVTPGKGGEWVGSLPVFDTVKAAVHATEANTSLISVPADHAADAIYEAVDAGIGLIVCITEGMPIQDTMRVSDYARHNQSRLVGPNCAGVLSPGIATVGIIPPQIAHAGHIGIVSKSGTLMYEVIYQLTSLGIGQSTCVSLGSDPITGMTLVDALELFEHDAGTDKIVLVGEIGGEAEIVAADYIKAHMTKPVVALIAGRSAPKNTIMGHYGAIIEQGRGDAQTKIDALQDSGVRIAESPEQVPLLLR